MPKCRDCIHDKVCSEYFHAFWGHTANKHSDLINADPKDCPYFKAHSRFVELPCKVGDTVYFNNVHLRYARVIAIYIDASGGMFDLDITTNIATATGYEHFINKDYTFEDIGKRLFLNREEAEQALKERET